MEPIQILEAIKEDIRDNFDGDPLMMRTMNLVITEYKARSERLHKPVVSGGLRNIVPKCPMCNGTGFDTTLPNYNHPPSKPEQLGNEGVAKSVSGGDDFDPFYDEGEEAKWEDRDITF